ncbi:hypothetical protein [Streptomyces cavernae]|uniref:hypothetical protein n=1 Tax=Streptomyces cavernae TaxID=2259034 RepID=UPI000FEC0ED9|nr:hypothetical protein [Streptomyces cavernae]
MRDLTPDARTLFFLSQEVTRSRNGRVCTPRDVVFAYVLLKVATPELASGNLAAQASTSPDMVQMGPEITAVIALETPEPVQMAELLDVAAEGNPDLADYLDLP